MEAKIHPNWLQNQRKNNVKKNNLVFVLIQTIVEEFSKELVKVTNVNVWLGSLVLIVQNKNSIVLKIPLNVKMVEPVKKIDANVLNLTMVNNVRKKFLTAMMTFLMEPWY